MLSLPGTNKVYVTYTLPVDESAAIHSLSNDCDELGPAAATVAASWMYVPPAKCPRTTPTPLLLVPEFAVSPQ